MKTRRTRPPAQAIADANTLVDAMLKPTCPRIGVRGEQRFVCRFPVNHAGPCYWKANGAKAVVTEGTP